MAERQRLYRTASVEPAASGFAVLLDGKRALTPARAALVLPRRALAGAVAAEFEAQGVRIAPATMPLTRLASIALDLVAPRRAEVVAGIAKYAETDLVCYRAAAPLSLAARHHQAWQPLLDWAEQRYGAPLAVTAGVLPRRQAPSSLRAIEAAVAAYDDWRLAPLNLATEALGSVVLALALAEGRIGAEEAFAASVLDESFAIERWGEDAEQAARRRALRDDIAAAHRFLTLLAA